jgi:hypothetical protein
LRARLGVQKLDRRQPSYLTKIKPPPQWAIFEPCFRRIRRSDVALATASTRIRNMEEVLGVPLLTRPRK